MHPLEDKEWNTSDPWEGDALDWVAPLPSLTDSPDTVDLSTKILATVGTLREVMTILLSVAIMSDLMEKIEKHTNTP